MDKTLKKVGRGVNKVTKSATNVSKAAVDSVVNMKKCVVEGVLVLLLAVYSGVVVNFCPISYLEFFENIIVKIVFLVVIAFVGLYSPSVALFLAIALIVNLQMAQKKKIARDLDVLSTGNTSPKVKENMADYSAVQEGEQEVGSNMMMQEQEQEMPLETFTNNSAAPAGYNMDASCVQSCQDTDGKSEDLSGQCGVVKTWENQTSAQGLQCPPGFSDSVGAPF
jgi:hypothetical protein